MSPIDYHEFVTKNKNYHPRIILPDSGWYSTIHQLEKKET